MFIKHNVRGEFDVFLGKGWDNWTRVKRTSRGVFGVAGNRLSHPTMREVQQAVNTRIPPLGKNVELEA